VKHRKSVILALGVLLLGTVRPGPEAWSQAAPLTPGAPLPRPVATPATAAAALQLVWKDLLPPGERDTATLAPPTALHDYLLCEDSPAAAQPMNSSVDEALDGRLVRIPGFIVPPPPPNQIVHVTLAKPLPIDSMDAAFWITGRLAVAKRRTLLDVSAYSVTGTRAEDYRF